LSLIGELKRRNVFRAAGAYVVVAWLAIQVIETIFPVFGFGDSAIRTSVIVLAIGMLPVVVIAWAFELTPDGLKHESDVNYASPVFLKFGKRVDRLVMVLLVLGLAYFAFDKFVLSSEREETLEQQKIAEIAAAHKKGRTEALLESFGDKSIAVLPFVNMSDDVNNEFFSDGISEELLNLLTKIPELRVTSRSSAFAFKGEKIDIPSVAEKLNVAHILEGSVRKAGNQVRITAQLIEGRSDTHLWSETYDRQLDDIFAIQDEIASTVVEQLKITLLGAVPKVKETNPAAYALYLQGRHLSRQRSAEGYKQAQTLLIQALAIDPNYAAAWAELSSVYIHQLNLGLLLSDEGLTLAREAVNKALTIDPDYALAHASLGWIAMTYDNDLAAAARHIERALQLEPANPRILRNTATLNASFGRLNEALALTEFVVSRDPVNPAANSNQGLYFLSAGRWNDAIASYRTALTLSPGLSGGQYGIGTALLLKGEPHAALEAMQLEDSIWGMIGLPLAYHALGRKDESDAALAALIEKYEQGAAYNIAYVLAYRGEADRAFEWLEKAVVYKDGGLSEILGERLFANIHDDPRWLLFLESIGKSAGQLAAIEFKVTLPK